MDVVQAPGCTQRMYTHHDHTRLISTREIQGRKRWQEWRRRPKNSNKRNNREKRGEHGNLKTQQTGLLLYEINAGGAGFKEKSNNVSSHLVSHFMPVLNWVT